MRRRVVVGVGVVALLLVALSAWQAWGQGPPPAAGAPFMPDMGPGWPPAPMATVVVADGVVYVACDGKVKSYDAKTLTFVAEGTYWERPKPQ